MNKEDNEDSALLQPTKKRRRWSPIAFGFTCGVLLQSICIFFLLEATKTSAGKPGLLQSQNEGPGLLLFSIGISQLLYVLPIYFLAKRKGASANFLKGFIIPAVLVFLLNAACWGTVL